jgi:hypothetical protein
MSKWIFAALGIVLVQSAGALAQTCPLPALADTAALTALPGSNLMTVPVAINGKPKQFLLALGSNPDEISQGTVSELGLPQIDRRSASNPLGEQNATFRFEAPVIDVRGAAAARSTQPRVRVASFTLGGASLPDFGLLVSSDRDLGAAKPYDGLLTASGFRKYDIDVDFGGGKLSFYTAAGCTDASQIVRWPHAAVAVIAMTMSGDKMIVPVTIGGHRIDAVIDTGFDRTVMRRAIAEQLFGLKADTPEMTAEGDMRDGAGQRVYRHVFPEIAFEGVAAGNVPALIQANSMVRRRQSAPATGSRLQAAADPGEPVPDLTLGMDVLRQLHLYIVSDQQTLYVTAAK